MWYPFSVPGGLHMKNMQYFLSLLKEFWTNLKIIHFQHKALSHDHQKISQKKWKKIIKSKKPAVIYEEWRKIDNARNICCKFPNNDLFLKLFHSHPVWLSLHTWLPSRCILDGSVLIHYAHSLLSLHRASFQVRQQSITYNKHIYSDLSSIHLSM